MIIVHVAIISGCLLASNNPSAVSVLVGDRADSRKNAWLPSVYHTRFQPVSMWGRGQNKLAWLRTFCDQSNLSSGQRKALESMYNQARIGPLAYMLWVLLPTLILITLPPAAGAFVAWQTPPIGWGCRSLTLVSYASSQLIMVLWQELLFFTTQSWSSQPWTLPDTWREVAPFLWYCSLDILHGKVAQWCVRLVYWMLCTISLFVGVGGTLMQVMGVYKNCFCYTNAQYWLNLKAALVNVASDTYDQRHSSTNWIYMGAFATGFMGVCALLGWWYQKSIRTKYRLCVGNFCKI